MNVFNLDEIQSFDTLELYFSFKLYKGFYIVFTTKTASKKIGALALSKKVIF